jgi:pimeloyl-ACP methyl ester carboxylesterase
MDGGIGLRMGSEKGGIMITYHHAEVSNLKIFYREAGKKEAPTIVLLHGFPTSSFMFRNLIPLLAETNHVIAPDYPGFGFSDALSVDDFGYTFDHLAGVMEEFLFKILGLKKFSILCPGLWRSDWLPDRHCPP